MKILILINENFAEMILGKNTSLGYILAAIDLKHDVHVCDIATQKIDKNAKAIYLCHKNAAKLIAKYKLENAALKHSPVSVKKVEDIFTTQETEIDLANIDFVIQRLEPMKSPFPPIGKISFHDFLQNFKQKFPPHFVFNYPLECYGDKELPAIIDPNLSTPTEISFIGDFDMSKKLQKQVQKYHEIFPQNTNAKIVLKPNNSAQTIGIFAIEFGDDGGKNFLDYENLQEKTIAQLTQQQTFFVKKNQDSKALQKIVEILCFVQNCKINHNTQTRKIKEISATEISQNKNLYNDKILIQPFLEGVKKGDVRINLAKLEDGNFYVVGAIFRKAIQANDQNFTTCLSAGESIATKIEDSLTQEESQNLQNQIIIILQKLNHQLKNKYKNCTEIGLDFILVGDKKNICFSEGNHYCPATIMASEAINDTRSQNNFYKKASGFNFIYDGGLAIAKKIINAQISLQQSASN